MGCRLRAVKGAGGGCKAKVTKIAVELASNDAVGFDRANPHPARRKSDGLQP